MQNQREVHRLAQNHAARQRAAAEQEERRRKFGMYCSALNDKAHWAERQQSWDKWSSDCFTNMAACSYCGEVSLSGPGNNWGTEPGDPTVSITASANPFLAWFCGPLATNMSYRCGRCNTDADYREKIVQHQVYMSTQYVRTLLSQPYLKVQMLSCLDARVNLVHRCENAFHHGELSGKSLLSNPLVTWDNISLAGTTLESNAGLRDLLASNMRTNPVMQAFSTMLELTAGRDPHTGMVTCTAESIRNIVHHHIERSPIAENMGEDIFDRGGLSVLDYEAVAPRASTFKMTTQKVFAAGNMHLREGRGGMWGRSMSLVVDPNGQQVMTPVGQGNAIVTIESAIFPFLFPHGEGIWRPDSTLSPFKSIMSYLNFRMKQLFSPFTLHLPYLMIMYQVRLHLIAEMTPAIEPTICLYFGLSPPWPIVFNTLIYACPRPFSQVRQACMLAQEVPATFLERELYKYKAKNPNATTDDAMKHIMKWKVPPKIEGSPRCHREALENLLTLAAKFGMPNLMVTLTADDSSEVRWKEIEDLERILNLFGPGFAHSQAPGECAAQFIGKFNKLLKEDILNSKNKARGGIFGRVQRYMYRYEVQERGSLHIHMVLWLHPDDIENISGEIVACVPAEFDPVAQQFIEPTNPLELQLYRLVTRKEWHKCGLVNKPGCREKGYCKYQFPGIPQYEQKPRFNVRSKRWDYYRPGPEHGWVVPYHAPLLLLWGAHVNVQRITNESWSRYLCKVRLAAGWVLIYLFIYLFICHLYSLLFSELSVPVFSATGPYEMNNKHHHAAPH